MGLCRKACVDGVWCDVKSIMSKAVEPSHMLCGSLLLLFVGRKGRPYCTLKEVIEEGDSRK